MKSKMMKKYLSYPSPTFFGLQCHINTPVGEYPLHRHDYIEIEYIVEGEMHHEINGYELTLKKGDCYCVYPHDVHSFKVISPVIIHNLCIDYVHAPLEVRKMLNGASGFMVGSIKDLTEINQWYIKLKELIEEEAEFKEERITAYCMLIISSIFENSKILERKLSGNFNTISKAMEYIGNNYSENIGLSDVACELYMSEGHISKLFTKINGVTFSEYLTVVRIEKAKTALYDTNKSITEIAYENGFGSFSTFSRSFKKLCGCTPSEYRKNTHK